MLLSQDLAVVFIRNISDMDALRARIVEFNRKLCYSYEKEGYIIEVSSSIGIVLMEQKRASFARLYERVAKAPYEVKQRGRNGYSIYSEK